MDSGSLFQAIDGYSASFHTDDSFDLLGDFNFDLDFTDFHFPELELDFDSLQPLHSQLEPTLFHTSFTDSNADATSRVQDWSIHSSSEPEDPLLVSSDENESSLLGTGGSPSTYQSNEKAHSENSLEQSDDNFKAKRKWEDSVTVFSSNDNWKVVQKRRKAYSPTRRKAVALNRLIGVCIQCKLRKGSVSLALVHPVTPADPKV
jgi:hypothetical protein